MFDVADTADGETLVSAHTFAAFPGPQGRVYGALVIGSRAHVVAVRRMLHGIRRRSLAAPG
ncbi:MAG TPA: hypothetical protein VER39_08540 [Nocardioidaceae bacterium]|nr:hypothetical protein [Nocardioidaceae bacterium]